MVYLNNYEIASRPVSNAEYLGLMADGAMRISGIGMPMVGVGSNSNRGWYGLKRVGLAGVSGFYALAFLRGAR